MSTTPRRLAYPVAWLVAGGALPLVGIWVAQDPGLSQLVGDPGRLVRWSVPVVRFGASVASAWCLGALVLGLVMTRPDRDASAPGELEGAGYGMLRTAVRAAGAWAVLAFVLVSLSAAQSAGLPLSRMTRPDRWWTLVSAQPEPRAWLFASASAVVIAAVGRLTLRWAGLVALSTLALLAVCAPLAAGHASSGANHDLATATILVHVPAAAVWVGAAITMATSSSRRVRHRLALARYGTVSGVCAIVVALSGLILASLLTPGPGATSAPYTFGIALKVALLAGVVVVVVRRHGAATTELLRTEIVLLVLAITVSTDLSQYFPAAFVSNISDQQIQLGYALLRPPSWRELAFDWRPEILFLAVVAAMVVAYLRAVRRLGATWPRRRTAWWLSGCVAMVLVTSSGIARYEAALFSSHMVSHTLLMCFVPLLLVQGAPLTLAAASSRAEAGDVVPSVHHLQRYIVGSRTGRALTHPVVVVVLFSGLSYVLYLTPLFDAASRYHWAHVVVAVVSFAIGYLFAWTVVGPDPIATPVPDVARMGMLLAAGPIAVVFPVVVIQTDRILGNGAASANFYSSLQLPWLPDLLLDQRHGAIWALALGEASMVVAALMLAATWGRRHDEDEYGAAELQEVRSRAIPPRLLADLVEVSQAQAVGHDQQRRQRHGAAGDQRTQPPGSSQRDGDHVVAEGPPEVPPDGGQRGASQP